MNKVSTLANFSGVVIILHDGRIYTTGGKLHTEPVRTCCTQMCIEWYRGLSLEHEFYPGSGDPPEAEGAINHSTPSK
jgi:hypothetical protein